MGKNFNVQEALGRKQAVVETVEYLMSQISSREESIRISEQRIEEGNDSREYYEQMVREHRARIVGIESLIQTLLTL